MLKSYTITFEGGKNGRYEAQKSSLLNAPPLKQFLIQKSPLNWFKESFKKIKLFFSQLKLSIP